MDSLSRRRFLYAGGTVAIGSSAGCVANPGEDATLSPTDATDEPNDGASLTDWERSTDCADERNSMYDSVIAVERAESGVGDEYVPIEFAELPSSEKEILRVVTEEGGYGTCDASGAFRRFVDRVQDRVERQDGTMHVYLERDGTYYGLYVEVTDQVFAY